MGTITQTQAQLNRKHFEQLLKSEKETKPNYYEYHKKGIGDSLTQVINKHLQTFVTSFDGAVTKVIPQFSFEYIDRVAFDYDGTLLFSGRGSFTNDSVQWLLIEIADTKRGGGFYFTIMNQNNSFTILTETEQKIKKHGDGKILRDKESAAKEIIAYKLFVEKYFAFSKRKYLDDAYILLKKKCNTQYYPM